MSYDPFVRSTSEWQQRLMDFMEHYSKTQESQWQEIYSIGQIYEDWLKQLTTEPSSLAETQSDFFADYLKFWEHYQAKMGGKDPASFIPPLSSDKRFMSPDWNENPFFYFYQQMYLMFVKHCIDFIEHHPGKDPKLAKQVAFFSRQALDALSPSNFVLTNPEVLKRTLEMQGENLTKGYKKFLEDLTRGHGHWTIEMTDMTAFEIGKDVAATKGKVIFQNRLIQLIQYEPTTDKVHAIPFLIVPPWINKYYILDLRERNSYIKWIVDQGYTVFTISWINPDERYRNVTFEDYLCEGLISTLDIINEITHRQEINALGFCVGGTLLAVALAYLQQKNDNRIKSATFLTTLIDFSEPGDIEVFIDERQISNLEKRMEQEGYLDGRLMMMTFNFLRSNDLYWSYFINNYLCGRDPFPFDLLYWNCDSTNLPAKMHSYYLRKFYLENQFYEGTLSIDGVPLNLQEVIIPCYFLSTEQDHIAPWKSTFSGTKTLNGEVEFVLGGSGHIAGVVNPPVAHKYGYRTNANPPHMYTTAESWFESSTHQDGSWWEHWEHWLSLQSGEWVAKRIPASEGKALQDAPGDYVKRKID